MLHALGRDLLLRRSSVAGATFMNEFAPHAMQAPPLMRHTHQKFTGNDYRIHGVCTWYTLLVHKKTKPCLLLHMVSEFGFVDGDSPSAGNSFEVLCHPLYLSF